MVPFEKAQELLKEFKDNNYLHGIAVLPMVGEVTAVLGSRAVLVGDAFPGSQTWVQQVKDSLREAGVTLLEEIEGAAPNAPREDLERITARIKALQPDVILSFGGGSTIDCTKAAEVLRTLGGDIEDYFGTGLVTAALEKSGKKLTPHIAIQTAASSGAHLTKYSNITDLKSAQKKLIVDSAIVPARPVFDYAVTFGAPQNLTADGALDGIAHSLEVLYSAVGKENYAAVEEIALESIRLVVNYLPVVMKNGKDRNGREALGLATDLGGYAIMVGGTNGGHLTSFSLVDVTSHGRACAIMNPYYTVFFAPAVEDALRKVAQIYKEAGYSQADFDHLSGRELGVAAAEAMINFQKSIGVPTTLGELTAFGDQHIENALTAAKNPQLKMKLENMPIPLNAEMVDTYMAPVLQAAKNGDLSVIKNV